MTLAAHIFLCSNGTQQECFDNQLFGGKEAYKKEIPEVNIGDTLYLFNYQSGMLHGIYHATSNAAMNIVLEAWGGKFPWQVKVELVTKYKPLSRADLVEVLTFRPRKNYPYAKVTEEQIQKLEELFKSDKRLPVFENVIPYTAEDGHRVRSKGELLICNWLYKNRVPHAYEKQLHDLKGVPETMYCDFFIPSSDTGTYIEFWGGNDKAYLKRKEEKLNFYRANSHPLIEVSPHQIKDLDNVLSNFLLK